MFGAFTKPIPPKSLNCRRPAPIEPVGTANFLFGYVGKKPGCNYKTQLAEYRMKADAEERRKNELEAKLLKKEQLCQDFHEKGFRRNTMTNIKTLVDCAKLAQTKDLNDKRSKLQDQLEKEYNVLEGEFITRLKTRVERELAAGEQKLLDVKKIHEQKAMEYVNEKKIQQYMNNCHDIRPYFSKQMLCDSKQSQVKQIEDNMLLQKKNKDIDAAWAEVEKRTYLDKVARDDEECRLRNLRNYCGLKVLKEQMQENEENKEIEKRERAEYQRRLKIKWKQMEEEDYQKQCEVKQKAIAVAKEIQEQRHEAAKFLAKRKQMDDEYDRMFTEATRKLIEKEDAAVVSGCLQRNKEARVYLQELEKMNEERRCFEEEKYKVIEGYHKEAMQKDYERCLEQKEKVMKLTQDTNTGLRAQIVQNEEKRKFEAAKEFQDAVEAREIYKYNETLDKAFDKRQRYNQLCYGQELLKQRDDYDERKRRELEEDKELARRSFEQDDYCYDYLVKLIGEGKTMYPIHPNREVIDYGKRRECPPCNN